MSKPGNIQPDYLVILARRNWVTWMTALVLGVGLNMGLFILMPHLLHRNQQKTVYDQFIPQINVMHLPRPEVEARRKIKPPEPPKPDKIQLQKRSQPHTMPQPNKLSLPFEIKPRLPAAPTPLTLPKTLQPSIEELSLENLGLKGVYDLSELDQSPIPVSQVPPPMPRRAIRMGITGWVKVRFIVTAQGDVDQLTIVAADPLEIFNTTVMHYVSRWRFKPGIIEGVPVNTQVETTIRFKLE